MISFVIIKHDEHENKSLHLLPFFCTSYLPTTTQARECRDASMPYSHWGDGVYDFHDSGMSDAYWFMVLEISGRSNFKKAILDHKILAEKQAQKLLPADVYPLRVYHSRGMATARITKQ